MKPFVFCLSILGTIAFNLTHAQDALPSIYAIIEEPLRAVDTIPDYTQNEAKIKLTGTLYKADGETPVSDALVVLSHADADGHFNVREKNGNAYVHHTAFVKTDTNGRYTFYTFVPGGDRRFNQMQELFLLVKIGEQPAEELPTLLFDADPLLTKRCRRRIAKRSESDRILKPVSSQKILEAEYDIVLAE